MILSSPEKTAFVAAWVSLILGVSTEVSAQDIWRYTVEEEFRKIRLAVEKTPPLIRQEDDIPAQAPDQAISATATESSAQSQPDQDSTVQTPESEVSAETPAVAAADSSEPVSETETSIGSDDENTVSAESVETPEIETAAETPDDAGNAVSTSEQNTDSEDDSSTLDSSEAVTSESAESDNNLAASSSSDEGDQALSDSVAAEDSEDQQETQPESAPQVADDAANTVSESEVIESAVRLWADSWSRQSVDEYLAFYSSDFEAPSGLTIAQWTQQRKQRLSTPEFIEVVLESLEVKSLSDNRAVVEFEQSYRSDRFSDKIIKRLELAKPMDRWQIVAESTLKTL
ncbi:MAG: hypothetical protein AAF402_02240 [Pseudomonadota bacterium]